MKLQRSGCKAAFVVLLALFSGLVAGQDYPSSTVRIVAPAAGGGADLVARIIAQGLTARLGQQFIVDNRGGPAAIAAEAVLKAEPDGHVLLFGAGAHWLLPLFSKVNYDPLKDFASISLTSVSPAVIAVHPSLNVKSIKELIALAKSKPGQLNIASGTKGSTTFLSAELFKAEAGVDIVSIPYKGAGPALAAAVSKQVDMIIITASSGMRYAKSGKLNVLAVASRKPSPLAPGVITTAETGLPGYESGTVHAFFAPARAPGAVIKRLNGAVVQFLTQPEVKTKMLNLGLEVVASSPEHLTDVIKTDIARVKQMLARIGSK